MTAIKPKLIKGLSLAIQGQAAMMLVWYASNTQAGDLIAKAIPKLDSSLSQTVSLNGGLIYDSNPLLADNAKEVWISRLLPRYVIQHNGDRGEQYLDLSMIVQRSSDSSLSANRNDPKVIMGINHLFNRGTFATNINYSKRSTRLAQVTETGLITDDGSITNKGFNSSFNYLFSSNLNGSVGFAVASNRFDLVGGELRDFNTMSLNGGLNYAFNSYVTGKVTFGATEIKRANGSGVLSNLMFGADWIPAPNLDMSLLVGLNHVNLDRLSSDTGLAADLGANYITDFNRVNASLNRSVRPNGLGLQEADRLNLGWNHTFNQDISYGATYQRLDTKNLLKVETQVATVFLNKKLNQEWNLNTYIKQRQLERSNNRFDGLTVGLTLGYGYSDFQDDY